MCGGASEKATSTQSREHLADRIEAWSRGEIDNLELDDTVWEHFGSDETFEVANAVWCCYDDFKSHPPTPGTNALLRRYAAFLRSGLDEAPKWRVPVFFRLFHRQIPQPFWPFADQAQWTAHRSLSTIEAPSIDDETLLSWVRFYRRVRQIVGDVRPKNKV
ncbi:MAG: hypothetical protein JST30_16185 [Armatimonadetes bacterium]|nr:hypothetical protein [Armatimonadota bacterium]